MLLSMAFRRTDERRPYLFVWSRWKVMVQVMTSLQWTPSPALRMRSVACTNSPFITERGERLDELTLAYETWGALNPRRDNAVLVFHALTGDSHAASHPEIDGDHPGWWEPVIGPGAPIDTDRHFVICANAPGSCYGSSGPASIAPDGQPYRLRFPALTVRDLVRAQLRLVESLGITRIQAAIGGSVGGMEALECALLAPEYVEQAIVVAASNRFHAQGIALNEIQRRTIMLDPSWRNGDYDPSRPPQQGLALARMLGMVSYQCDVLMEDRFGRNPARYTQWPEFQTRFDVEGYLHYQGDKLASRFDANSYLYLSRAMDSHDIGEGRGGLHEAAAALRASSLFVGISSDILFPPSYVRDSARLIQLAGGAADYVEMNSNSGHDSFLKDFDELATCIRPALAAHIGEGRGRERACYQETMAD
ncbi:MAG: homoserine O-acetyltransferase MetX [Chloroflexota bacterium]